MRQISKQQQEQKMFESVIDPGFISRAGCFDRTAGALFIICLFFWFYVQGMLFVSLHFYFDEHWLFYVPLEIGIISHRTIVSDKIFTADLFHFSLSLVASYITHFFI